MNLKSLPLFTILLLTAFSLTSCGASGKKSYLSDYSKLHESAHLKRYWSSDSLAEQKYAVIYVKPINIDGISEKKDVAVRNCVEWLWGGLAKASSPLRGRLVFNWNGEISKNRSGSAVLEIAITEMGSGSASPRILTGDFQAGHAWVQVDGRVLDLETNEELAAFSSRRHASGTSTLERVSGDAGPTLVREMLEDVASDIVMEVKDSFGF